MAQIALQNQRTQDALTYWAEAWQLAQQTQNAQGLYNVGRSLGSLLADAGDQEHAIPILTTAIAVGRASGFQADELENTLKKLNDDN